MSRENLRRRRASLGLLSPVDLHYRDTPSAVYASSLSGAKRRAHCFLRGRSKVAEGAAFNLARRVTAVLAVTARHGVRVHVSLRCSLLEKLKYVFTTVFLRSRSLHATCVAIFSDFFSRNYVKRDAAPQKTQTLIFPWEEKNS